MTAEKDKRDTVRVPIAVGDKEQGNLCNVLAVIMCDKSISTNTSEGILK